MLLAATSSSRVLSTYDYGRPTIAVLQRKIQSLLWGDDGRPDHGYYAYVAPVNPDGTFIFSPLFLCFLDVSKIISFYYSLSMRLNNLLVLEALPLCLVSYCCCCRLLKYCCTISFPFNSHSCRLDKAYIRYSSLDTPKVESLSRCATGKM
jgi:hypothetical protein